MNSKHSIALPPDTRLQNYRVIKVLGQGGFGITYLANDEALNKQVAIKEFLPSNLATRDMQTSVVKLHRSDDSEAFQWGLKRFLEEARILAKLSHPNIVRVLNFMTLNDTGYMIMEYEEGQVLKNWSHQFPGNRPPQHEIFKLLGPLLSALRDVHSAGLAHRDIKPDNIYIRHDDTPVLLDFGAARNIESGRSHTFAAIVASGYSPHEQYGKVSEQGPWTDIYALGAVLCRLITGTTPPDAPSRTDASMSEAPDPFVKLVTQNIQGYDKDFLTAIDWALELRAKDRPQNINEWVSAFGDFAREATQIKTEATSRLGITEQIALQHADPTQAIRSGNHPAPETEYFAPSAHTPKKRGWGINLPASFWIGTAATLLLVTGGFGAYWWLSQNKSDLIGNTPETAFPLGTLSNSSKQVSDNIGGADQTDIIMFDIASDSEVRIEIKNAPRDLGLHLTDPTQNAQGLYRDEETYVAQLRRGSYTLRLTSNATFSGKYALSLKASPTDLHLKPGNKLSDALDVAKLGQPASIPVRYRGKLFPGQKEHYFRLRASQPSTISLTANVEDGIGRITLADKTGIAIESEKLTSDQAQILKSSVEAGTYYIILNANQKTVFDYGLTIRVDRGSKIVRNKPKSPKTKIPFIAVNKPKGPLLRSSASAQLSAGMSREEALLAAQTLARIRLAEKAQNRPESSALPSQVVRLANVVKLLPAFNAGVPFDENWKIRWEKDKQVFVDLNAHFEPTEKKQYLYASLVKNIVKARTPIRLKIQPARDMYIGIFAWQADGTVLRIYPRQTGQYFLVTSGQKIELPAEGEQEIMSEPAPGRSSSDEAIFIAGCYAQADYTRIAPSIWEISDGSQDTAIKSSTFLQRIGTSCKQGLSIQVLNYIVRSES